jgi:hypothetical protein
MKEFVGLLQREQVLTLCMIMMTQQTCLRCAAADAVKHDPRRAQGAATWVQNTHSFSDGGCAALSQRCSVRSRCPRFEQTV